ncbi:MAG: MFS transporter [Bifidobacteriaceae bacterium]|jgi:MFS family permease|nr:MFS transporter [Bifidobacteriaceae bacterium]
MSFATYGHVLRAPGVTRLVLISVFARLPHATTGIVLSLHIINGMGLSYTKAGIAAAIFTIGLAIGAPWRGRLVDRRGVRRAVFTPTLVTLLGWCSLAFLPYPLLLAACLVMGVFVIPIFPIIRQSLSVMVQPSQLPTAFALDAVITEFTFVVGPIVATQLVLTWHSRVAMIAVGVASALAGAGLFWLNPPTRSANSPSGPHPTGRLITLTVAAILVCSLATTFTLAGVDLAVVASMRSWLATGGTGLILAIWASGSLVGGLIYGALPRQAPIAPLVGALAVTTAACALATSPTSLAVLVFVSGLFCAPTMVSVNHGLADSVPEQRRGEVMGWNGTMLQLGGAAAAPMVGVAIDGHGAPAGYVVAGIAGATVMVVALALIGGRRRYNRKNATLPPDQPTGPNQ